MADVELGGLPGSEIVLAGLDDLAAGRESANASAVAMASRRLTAAGIDVPSPPAGEPAGHSLYRQLTESGERDPHSRYNAVVRRVLSFIRAVEHARRG